MIGTAIMNLADNVKSPDLGETTFQTTRDIKFTKCGDKNAKLRIVVSSDLKGYEMLSE
jgi:hypothetical protein